MSCHVEFIACDYLLRAVRLSHFSFWSPCMPCLYMYFMHRELSLGIYRKQDQYHTSVKFKSHRFSKSFKNQLHLIHPRISWLFSCYEFFLLAKDPVWGFNTEIRVWSISLGLSDLEMKYQILDDFSLLSTTGWVIHHFWWNIQVPEFFGRPYHFA